MAAAAVALLIPLWAVAYPPLVDYPNHLARSYVLAHIHDFDTLAQNYRVDMRPLPYLTVDLALMAMLDGGDVVIIVTGVQDAAGNVLPTHSVSAGLDYPAVGRR